LQFLHREFPGDAFCAEEASSTLAGLPQEGPRLWIIDPIDGTRGFAKKIGEFSVMIGLVERGLVQVGVVFEPARSRGTFAVRGEGCWRQDGGGPLMPCEVSTVAKWDQATVVRSWSEQKNVNATIQAAGKLHYTYSAGVKLAMVARGEVEAYVSTYTGFHSWDVCAGQILVEQAGGSVTDLHGRPILYRQDGTGAIAGTAASNGLLQQESLAALR
jgi:3'(2'), 5'-bisphosphate nucleotidase